MKCMAKNRMLVLLICGLLLIGLLPVGGMAEADPDADDNVKVTFQYSTSTSTGNGTKENPYTYELNYRSSKTDKLEIKTVNPLAKINGGSNAYTVSLDYGWNNIEFTVTSADQTKTAYYHIRWSRTKQTRNEYLKKGDIFTEPATDATTADGKIVNLNTNEAYEYRLQGDSSWTCVSGVTEILNLRAGTYEIHYGESATHKRNDNYTYISIPVGCKNQPFTTINKTSYEIVMPEKVYIGQRVTLKIKLTGETFKPVGTVSVTAKNSANEWGQSIRPTVSIRGYEAVGGVKYAVASFVLSGISASESGCTLTIDSVTLLKDNYYEITGTTGADALVAGTTVVPKNTSDAIAFDKKTLYKAGSTVTISLTKSSGAGVDQIQSFDVCKADGTVVESSTDGSPITVTVTENLHIANVKATYLPANFTAMEAQLARVKGADLTLYTDDSRVALQERLALAEQMYKCTAKDQKLIDDFVPTLQKAIDELVPKAGDYREITKAKARIPADGSVYTDESWSAVAAAAAAAQTAMDEQWNRLKQAEISTLAARLNDAIDKLQYKPADYTGVNKAIAKANALNKEEYSDFSAVEAAFNAVIWDKNVSEQAEVNAMAKAIEDAIAALEKREAAQTALPPQTGDHSPIEWLFMLLILSGAGLCAALYSGKRKSVDK